MMRHNPSKSHRPDLADGLLRTSTGGLMRQLTPAFVGLVAASLLAGCPDREVSEVIPIQEKEEFKSIPVQINRDVDLLFVVDNSGSMREEQDSLAANFPEFINVLNTIEGGLPNIHLGVISTDVGAGPGIGGCQSPDNGLLQTRSCFTSTDGRPFIKDIALSGGGRDRNYDGSLAAAFSCNATLGTLGCGFEQHLESMRRALNGSRPENAGFLRDSAYLAIVIISDEDDCSTENPQMFDTASNPTLGALHSFRCFEFGVDCDGPADRRAPGPRTDCRPRESSPYMFGVQEYVDFLRSVKSDPGLIIVANVVGNPEPVVVGTDPTANNVPALVPSCSSGSGVADPAVRLVHFANQFSNNTFTTICNENLSDALQQIAELLKEVIGNPCITALLKDRDPDQAGLQYECTVSDVVNPNGPDRQETILPHCNAAEDLDPTNPPNSTNVPCWHLHPDAERCGTTPTQLSLVVERGGASVPPNTHVQARCITCVDENRNGVCDEFE
jgi:hypothetical protein